MATFYGEVLPIVSRAVDEDEDDYETVSDLGDPFIQWSSQTQNALLNQRNNKMECSLLIIAIGPAAVGFTETYIKHGDYHLVAGIYSGPRDSDPQPMLQNAPTDKACYLYCSNQDASTFICLCSTDVAAEQYFVWVNQLFSVLEASEAHVVVLNTLPTSQFTSDVPASDLPLPLLRGLNTSKFDGSLKCPLLEQPNLVPGLAAQVMTYCQVLSIKAVLYQCYTSSRRLVDLQTLRAFIPVLESTFVRDIIKKHPDAEERLRDIVELHKEQDTLYI